MRVYIGIDWSHKQQEVAYVNAHGVEVAHATLATTPTGLMQLDQLRQKLQVEVGDCVVALETAHHLLIDFLWARGYEALYVIPPSVTTSARGRYRASGARTDRSDALVLANLLRTDQHRLQPWRPDLPCTQQLRSNLSLLVHLQRDRIRWSNRLWAVLSRFYPAALHVFGSLCAQISLQFIHRYPTPQAAKTLSLAEFEAFARAHGYPRPKALPAAYARLQAEQPEAALSTVSCYREEVLLLSEVLLRLVQAECQTQRQLTKSFRLHPDQAIFASLPGTGDLLAPALLVKFGDDRARFPTPASLQALAGTAPVTEWSGQRRQIRFRRACDRHFRQVAQQWARCSLAQSAWANAYFTQARTRGLSTNQALRCLANRWLAIAWKLWHDRQCYDESYHLQQRQRHARPLPQVQPV